MNGSRPGYLPLSVDRNRLLQIRTDDDISTIRFDAHHHKVPPEYVAVLTVIGVKVGGRIDYLHRDPLPILPSPASQYIFRALQELVKSSQFLFGSNYP